MSFFKEFTRRVWYFGLVIVFAVATARAADKPLPKPSTYAPVADLASQIEYYVKQIETDLAADADYGTEQKDRVAKDANTLIVLAQVLANHDQEHDLRKAAADVFAASRQLADAAGDFTKAKSALEAVKKAMHSRSGGQVDWEPAAELSQLMRQVPIVNNRLRSGVMGRRFDRTVDQNAGHAATLAAIAHMSRFDTNYCSGKEDEIMWAKICDDMRAAAAEIHQSVRNKDQATAKTGLDKMVKTCDACHHDFRD